MCKEHSYVSVRYWDTQYSSFIRVKLLLTTVWLVKVFTGKRIWKPSIADIFHFYIFLHVNRFWMSPAVKLSPVTLFLLVCLVGSESARASCLSDRPTTCTLMLLARLSLGDFFPDQGVLWKTDILSTGRPKLGYCSWLWQFRLISPTTESWNVTLGLRLCWDKQVIQFFDLSVSESETQMSTAEPI